MKSLIVGMFEGTSWKTKLWNDTRGRSTQLNTDD